MQGEGYEREARPMGEGLTHGGLVARHHGVAQEVKQAVGEGKTAKVQ